MRVLLFAKKNKPYVEKVISYLASNSDLVSTYVGERAERFPDIEQAEPYDVIVSYLSPWVIPQSLLNKSKMCAVNFHPGPPEYPGIGCFNFALYDSVKDYGVTAHLMEAVVDTGRIIGVKRFSIAEDETVYSLSLKTYDYLYSLFVECMDFILQKKKIPETEEMWTRKAFTRADLERLCEVNFSESEEEIEKRIKATLYPNMPGPYVKLGRFSFEYNPKR